MDLSNISLFLKFVLTSYAAIFFYTAGIGFALSKTNRVLRPFELILLFVLIAIALNLSFRSENLDSRLIIAGVWTSVLWIGFRFGRKIIKHNNYK